MASISIFGYYGQQNAGDEAILSSLITGISEQLPQAKVTVFSGDAAGTRKAHRINAVQSTLPGNLTQFATRSLGRNRRNFFRSLVTFFRSDVILVGGGGLFIDDPDSNSHLLNYLRLIWHAKALGKKIMLVGVSVGPLYHQSSRKAVRDTLNEVDLIAVRDTASKELLLECGVTKPDIQIAPDLVYSLTPCPPMEIDRICATESLGTSARIKVAITPCSYNSELPGWLESYVAFGNHAIDTLNAELWLIPMQTSALHDDRGSARMIIKGIHRKEFAHCIEGTYGPRQILGLISRADAVLGERLHGSIMALNAAVPFFGIGYMPKVTRLFDEIGHPEWCLPIDKLAPPRLISGFDHVFNTRDSVAPEIAHISATLRKQSAFNFELIKRLVSA